MQLQYSFGGTNIINTLSIVQLQYAIQGTPVYSYITAITIVLSSSGRLSCKETP